MKFDPDSHFSKTFNFIRTLLLRLFPSPLRLRSAEPSKIYINSYIFLFEAFYHFTQICTYPKAKKWTPTQLIGVYSSVSNTPS